MLDVNLMINPKEDNKCQNNQMSNNKGSKRDKNPLVQNRKIDPRHRRSSTKMVDNESTVIYRNLDTVQWYFFVQIGTPVEQPFVKPHNIICDVQVLKSDVNKNHTVHVNHFEIVKSTNSLWDVKMVAVTVVVVVVIADKIVTHNHYDITLDMFCYRRPAIGIMKINTQIVNYVNNSINVPFLSFWYLRFFRLFNRWCYEIS